MRIQLNYMNSDIINLTFIKALTGARVKLTSVFSIKVKVKSKLAKQNHHHRHPHHQNISGDYLPYSSSYFFH